MLCTPVALLALHCAAPPFQGAPQAPALDAQPTPSFQELCVQTYLGGLALVDPAALRVRLWIGEPGERSKDIARSPDGRWLARLLMNDRVVIHDIRDGSEWVRFESLPFVAPPQFDWDYAPTEEECWGEDRRLCFGGQGDRIVLARGHRASELWSLDPVARIDFLALEGDVLVTALDVSRDGALIATGDRAGRVALWDAGDGRLLREPWILPGEIAALHFDPSGARLAIGDALCGVHVLSLADGALRTLFRCTEDLCGYHFGVDDLAFDPTGGLLMRLAKCCSPPVCAWRAGSGEVAWRCDPGRLEASRPAARFSPDGSRLILSSAGIVLDARTGAVLRRAFPGRNDRLETNGELSWIVDDERLLVFTFDRRVSVRELRLDRPADPR